MSSTTLSRNNSSYSRYGGSLKWFIYTIESLLVLGPVLEKSVWPLPVIEIKLSSNLSVYMAKKIFSVFVSLECIKVFSEKKIDSFTLLPQN